MDVASIEPSRSKTRIAIVTCYFGIKPWYFDFFAKSCSANPEIDFLLITDIPFEVGDAKNIIVVDMSFTQVAALASRQLGIPLRLDYPYKLCDFKPAYGFIFRELLHNYDFWGHGDLDVVYGQIRNFITDELLGEYDIISASKSYISGFFTLYRNIEPINKLFKKSRDFQSVLQTPRYQGFDETNWQWKELDEGKNILSLKNEIESMTYIVVKEILSNRLKVCFGLPVYEEIDRTIAVEEGRLFLEGQEIFLFHLIFFKALDYVSLPSWTLPPSRFYFSGNQITRHHPGTMAAKLSKILATVRRGIFLRSNYLKEFTKWSFARWRAVSLLNKMQFPHYKEAIGKYELWEGDTSLQVLEINGRLYLRGDDGKLLALKHKSGARFIPEVFILGKWWNVEIELVFDKMLNAWKMTVTSFQKKRTTLFKEKKDL